MIRLYSFFYDEFHSFNIELNIQQMLQDFACNEIAPIAARRDEEEYFDREAYKQMAAIGLAGIPWPGKYGGAGLDYMAFINAMKELSKVSGSTG